MSKSIDVENLNFKYNDENRSKAKKIAKVSVLYEVDAMSPKKISQEVGMSTSKVRYVIKKYGYKKGSRTNEIVGTAIEKYLEDKVEAKKYVTERYAKILDILRDLTVKSAVKFNKETGKFSINDETDNKDINKLKKAIDILNTTYGLESKIHKLHEEFNTGDDDKKLEEFFKNES